MAAIYSDYTSGFDFNLRSSLAYQFASIGIPNFMLKGRIIGGVVMNDVISIFDTAAADVANQLPVPL